jgi:hypothetical protein
MAICETHTQTVTARYLDDGRYQADWGRLRPAVWRGELWSRGNLLEPLKFANRVLLRARAVSSSTYNWE